MARPQLSELVFWRVFGEPVRESYRSRSTRRFGMPQELSHLEPNTVCAVVSVISPVSEAGGLRTLRPQRGRAAQSHSGQHWVQTN